MTTQPIFVARISTMISGLFRGYVQSLPSVGSWECARCGLRLGAQRTAGTSELSFVIGLVPPSLSHFKHSVDLTLDGKLSILCESVISDDDASEDSGRSVGTYSSPKNSARTQREAMYTTDDWRYVGMTIYDHARDCGCDPVADHMCERHQVWITNLEQ